MHLFVKIFLLAIFCQLNFFHVEACCPYFNTEQFKSRGYQLNSSSMCQEPFDEFGVMFSGEDWCGKLFAGRAFCKWTCMAECGMDVVSSVYCPKPMCGPGGGHDPNDVFIACNCNGRLRGSNMGSSCNTRQHSWMEIDNAHTMYCLQGRKPFLPWDYSEPGLVPGGPGPIVDNGGDGNSKGSGTGETGGVGSNVYQTNNTSITNTEEIHSNTDIKDTKFIYVGLDPANVDQLKVSPELANLISQLLNSDNKGK